MRPILLQGHTRSLTMVRYNREGDLLFTCSKDSTPNVWLTTTGERLGTYKGHMGAVWCLATNYTTERLLTGSADWSAKMWDAETGKELYNMMHKTPVRSVDFALGDATVLVVTDAIMGQPSQVLFYDARADSTPVRAIELPLDASKITVAKWGPLNRTVLTGHNDGELSLFDIDGTKIESCKEHSGTIMDLQYAPDQTYFISASKDMTAKLFDTDTLRHLKTYQTDRPVNSASIAPDRDHVLVGGGQEAMQVTTSSLKAGKFEVRVFHKVLADEIGRIKGHFGPINTVNFHPSGRGFASGGEDGYVRLHTFDPDYFEFKVDY